MTIQSHASLTGMVVFVILGSCLLPEAKDVTAVHTVSGKWVVNTDQPASIAITNVMDGGAKVLAHCHTSQQDKAITVIASGLTYSIVFQDNLNVNVPWVCEFSHVGAASSQVFTVWTHDGTPYLSVCDECSWKVANDGFYILNSGDGLYYKMYSWI